MVLVDTSVWVDHLRRGDAGLARLLDSGQVLTHAFVIGELALGQLQQRDAVLGALSALPQTEPALDREVLHFIAAEGIAGRGIGYIDAHLLASVRLTPGSTLWTRDKRLLAQAVRLRCAWTPQEH